MCFIRSFPYLAQCGHPGQSEVQGDRGTLPGEQQAQCSLQHIRSQISPGPAPNDPGEHRHRDRETCSQEASVQQR